MIQLSVIMLTTVIAMNNANVIDTNDENITIVDK